MWECHEIAGLRFHSWQPWWQAGYKHGFCGTGLNFSKESSASSALEFCQKLNLNRLILPLQCHGTQILDLRLAESFQRMLLAEHEADAVLANLSTSAGGADSAIGILTADCIPLFIKSEHAIAVVHAGWRGLANGIIKQALKHIESGRGAQVEVLIGPCAGPEKYEVGPEVLQEIGELAVSYPSGTSGKVLLSLAESAKSIIRHECPNAKLIEVLNECTISNRQFFSYRREGMNAGRNLSFCLV